MAKKSAGLLLFRRTSGSLEVLLVHPGGPFWARRDLGAWTIPKGEHPETEEPLAAARREFQEETGQEASGEFLPLGSIRQKSGKHVTAWALERDFDPESLCSNTVFVEWPPRSGRKLEVPEVDRAQWFSPEEAYERILEAQRPLLDALQKILR